VAERARRSRVDALLLLLASLAGTLPPAVLAAICLARLLPLHEDTRFTLGFMLAIPLWVTAICVVCLARTATRAWAVCLAASAALAALAVGLPS
jgi:hypothetical protein